MNTHWQRTWRWRWIQAKFWWFDVTKRPRRAVWRFLHPGIHTPTDGRGPRAVYLDGKLIGHVTYADTRLGFIRMGFHPAKVSQHRGAVRSRKRYGHIEIKPL